MIGVNRLLLATGLLILGQFGFAQEFVEVSVDEEKFKVSSSKGISIADYDNDGDDDFYVTASNEDIPNRLFRNDGNWNFTDVTEESGLGYIARSKTAIWFDANTDGLLDIYISNVRSRDQLFQNNGDGSFTNITESTGIINVNTPFSVLCGDLNGDFWPDIYVTNFLDQNQLWINQENFSFQNKIIGSGAESKSKDMGAVMYDYDMDGDQDIYITYDGGDPNKLLENDGTGAFIDVAPDYNMDYQGFGMGVDFADFNHDGTYDIYITNLYDNLLYLSSNNNFSDVAAFNGLNDYGMTWGVIAFDYNNDTHSDIYIINEYGFSPYSNILYRNNGNGNFVNVSNGTPMESNYNGFGGAYGDFDQDGKLDIVVANVTDPGVQVFKNQSSAGNYLSFTLLDDSPNLFAIGAKVQVQVDGVWLYDEVTAGSGYNSQNSYNIHFGTADKESVEAVKVIWTNGETQTFESVSTNKRYLLVNGSEIQEFDAIVYSEILAGNTPPPSDEVVITSTLKTEKDLSTWPNPVNEELNISISGQLQKVTVTNTAGQEIALPISKVNDNHWKMNTSQLPEGIYQLAITSESEILYQRIIKQ